jgi:hypothetical protein
MLLVIVIWLINNIVYIKSGDCDSVGNSYCYQYGYSSCYEWNDGSYAGCTDPNGNIAQYQAGYVKDGRSCDYWNRASPDCPSCYDENGNQDSQTS